jgi:uncharacterized NAD(P)/FAD-binding protein YdhS
MPSVAVVGAGFSGALLALHLLKVGPMDLQISLIDRAGGFGRGLAYGARNPRHLLNVRVGNMSAWPDDPGHLAAWLTTQGETADPAAFISRETYGAYLSAQLRAAVSNGGAGRLLLEHDQVTNIARVGGRLTLTLGLGHALEADAVVLAMGNLPPAAPPGAGIETLPAGAYAADPWDPAALEDLDAEAPVLLLGTGLTMVDVAIDLETRGHRGPILALSRRGLVPRRHHGAPHDANLRLPPAEPLSTRLAAFRWRAAAIDWRVAIDEVRPATQDLWRAAGEAERRRFLRHLRPWWDVHRHRMAPQIADWLERHPRLSIAAGRLQRVAFEDERVRVDWRPRGAAVEATLRVARIINCSGVGADLRRSRDPLLRHLVDTGGARLDPLGLGLEIDADGRVLCADGHADGALWAVGPITRGALWEITAVPDIRAQVAQVAASLAAGLG